MNFVLKNVNFNLLIIAVNSETVYAVVVKVFLIVKNLTNLKKDLFKI